MDSRTPATRELARRFTDASVAKDVDVLAPRCCGTTSGRRCRRHGCDLRRSGEPTRARLFGRTVGTATAGDTFSAWISALPCASSAPR